jgi:hypothetical protein
MPDRKAPARHGATGSPLMGCIRALVLLASLILVVNSADANVLNDGDFQGLRSLREKTFKLGIDITAAAAHSDTCLPQLTIAIEKFDERFQPLTLMVMLASRMVDITDEKEVIRVLSIEAPPFLKALEAIRQGTNNIMAECTQDSPTAAKGQELLRIFDTTASQLRSIIKKIKGAKQP